MDCGENTPQFVMSKKYQQNNLHYIPIILYLLHFRFIISKTPFPQSQCHLIYLVHEHDHAIHAHPLTRVLQAVITAWPRQI